MNQGKLEVVKQEMARVKVDILGISELKWTGIGEFNSDDHYIYYCGQESLRRIGVCFTANNTLNALFARIEGVYGVPFVIDDITTNPHLKNQLTQFIYTLADGTNKGRLNGNSELCEEGLGWSGVAITSSETPILDYGEQER